MSFDTEILVLKILTALALTAMIFSAYAVYHVTARRAECVDRGGIYFGTHDLCLSKQNLGVIDL